MRCRLANWRWWLAIIATAVAVLSLGRPLVPEAQQPGKVYRIGVLHLTPDLSRMEAFRDRLSKLGYVEGQDIAILDRLAEGRVHRLPELAAELVRLKVDVIVTGGTTTTYAAQQATSTIPIVMAADDSPVEDGFIVSLGRPGTNITGLSTLSRELNGKRLALLKEAIPRIARVAVLSNPANRSAGPGLSMTKAAAQSMGLQLVPIEVRGPDEFESAFSAIAKGRAQALILGHQDPLFHVHAQQVADLALKGRLPAVFYLKDFAEWGGSCPMHRATPTCSDGRPSTSTRSSRALGRANCRSSSRRSSSSWSTSRPRGRSGRRSAVPAAASGPGH